jgi:hypothetical protein
MGCLAESRMLAQGVGLQTSDETQMLPENLERWETAVAASLSYRHFRCCHNPRLRGPGTGL